MDAVEGLAGMRAPTPLPVRIRRVVKINTGGSVDVDYGPDDNGAAVPITVPCLDGYHTRAVGDRVLILQTAEVGWVVLGKVGAAPLT